MNGSNDNKIRPEFSAYNDLWEQKSHSVVESLVNLARHSASTAGILCAIIALSYIAKKFIEAGNELSSLSLFGSLVIAVMIVAIAFTVFFVELRSNAQINKKSFDQSSEPTDERQCSQKTGEAPG